MTKIYVSGKITGNKNYKKDFSKTYKKLTKCGYSVLTPTMIYARLGYDDYMQIDFKMIEVCDCIYVLNGYESSPGVERELKLARELGKQIVYEKDVADKKGLRTVFKKNNVKHIPLEKAE